MRTTEAVAVMSEQTFHVKGIRCQGCERTIRTILTEVDGIQSVEADRHTDAVTVGFDELRVSANAVVARLADAGYPLLHQAGRPGSRRFWHWRRGAHRADR